MKFVNITIAQVRIRHSCHQNKWTIFHEAEERRITNSMQHSPLWDANRSSASQEIPHIVWNPKVHYRIHKCPVLSHISPAPALPPLSHFLKIHFNIIFSSSPMSSTVPQVFHQNTVCPFHLPHTCYMPRPSYSSWFDHPNNIWWGVQIIQLLIT